MKRMALPAGRLKPSAGAGLQTSESTVTRAGLVQVGGLPALARPNANTLRSSGVSQAAATPLAIHAAGTPPEATFSAPGTTTPGWPMQSKGFLQTLIGTQVPAPAPVQQVAGLPAAMHAELAIPSVMRPPKC